MDWKDTVMGRVQVNEAWKEMKLGSFIPKFANYGENHPTYKLLKIQAEITGKIMYQEGIREVVKLALQSIANEPEYPSDMPNELWQELNGNRINTLKAMRSTVRLTKNGITERLLAKLKSGGLNESFI